MHQPMTPERLAQIRAREAAATPGPWTWFPGRIDAPDNDDEHFSSEIIMWVGNIPSEYDGDDAAAALGACGTHAEEDAAANLAFLAAARQDVPALLAEIDRLNNALAVAERQRDLLLKANLQLHEDIERVRLEVGGTRAAVVEWQALHSGRAPSNFGTDEERARECVARENEIWGPGDSRLRSWLTFVSIWRDAEMAPE